MKKYKCEMCEDTGKVPCSEFDPDSGQWQNGVGEQICKCKIRDEADDDDSEQLDDAK